MPHVARCGKTCADPSLWTPLAAAPRARYFVNLIDIAVNTRLTGGTTADLFGDTTQTLLVTHDLQGSALPVGSLIETVSLGTGFENIYTDIASTSAGGDQYTDTLVTPFGDFSIPVDVDAAAGLAADHFLNLLF
jgi:hypothetical protein